AGWGLLFTLQPEVAMMLANVRALVLPLFLTASLALISGCGGSPTTPPAGGGPGADYRSKMEQMQKANMENIEKMKKQFGGAPKEENKGPGGKDEPKN